MSSGVFVVDVLLSVLLSGYLLFSYGNWLRQRVFVTLAVLVAWDFSFMIIFVLPLDVTNTAYRQCLDNYNLTVSAYLFGETETAERLAALAPNATTGTGHDAVHRITPHCVRPYSYLPDEVLLNLWRVVYWSSQLLTWLALPLMQSYTQAGEFGAWGKLKSSLWDNAIYYCSYLFIALVLVIYIWLQPGLHLNGERLKAIAASASNTWGLCVLVLMLGYGLVEVPRNLWHRTERGYQLNRAYFKVAKLMTERTDADEALDDCLVSVHAVSQVVSQADLRRPHVETILQKIPCEMMEKIKRRRGAAASTGEAASFATDPPTERTLTRLHRQVIRALQNHHRVEAQWTDMTQRVFELEDVNRNMISNEHVFKRTLSRPPHPWLAATVYNPMVEWYWKCLWSPLLMRIAAGAATVMSAVIIWSEVTFFSISTPLSLFAVFVNLAKSSGSYFLLEMICFCSICYLCLCTYYTIFKIRVLNYYYLASNHQSDEYTLLFSGALLCRLTPPLCLNFLSLVHMDSHVIHERVMETAYTRVMGHMDVVSIVSDYFNIYFPIALLALALATYFSVGARLLSVLGFQQFLDQDSEVTLELIEEGKEHIKREKRRIQRLMDSANRRREFASRFNDAESGEARGGGRGPSSDFRFPSNENIVKSRQQLTSPERSLLGDGGLGGLGGSGNNDDAGSIVTTETIDLSSPDGSGGAADDVIGARGVGWRPTMANPQRQQQAGGVSRGAGSPPRNIFDDL